jgi:hypothetical protein
LSNLFFGPMRLRKPLGTAASQFRKAASGVRSPQSPQVSPGLLTFCDVSEKNRRWYPSPKRTPRLIEHITFFEHGDKQARYWMRLLITLTDMIDCSFHDSVLCSYNWKGQSDPFLRRLEAKIIKFLTELCFLEIYSWGFSTIETSDEAKNLPLKVLSNSSLYTRFPRSNLLLHWIISMQVHVWVNGRFGNFFLAQAVVAGIVRKLVKDFVKLDN